MFALGGVDPQPNHGLPLYIHGMRKGMSRRNKTIDLSKNHAWLPPFVPLEGLEGISGYSRPDLTTPHPWESQIRIEVPKEADLTDHPWERLL
jgi:hypothetical protein